MTATVSSKAKTGVLRMVEVLHAMYYKKVKAEVDYTQEEMAVLEKIENSVFLRAFVDHRIGFERPVGHVPSKMELDMVYASIRGEMPDPSISSQDIMYLMFDRLGVLGGYVRD